MSEATDFFKDLVSKAASGYEAKQAAEVQKAVAKQEQWKTTVVQSPGPTATDNVYGQDNSGNQKMLIIGGLALLAVVGLVVVLR